MNEKILFIGSCIISLGILLYGMCWIITCQQGEFLLSIYYQISILIMVVGGFCVLLGILKIKNDVK